MLSVHEIKVQEVLKMVEDGRIIDGKTIAGLFFMSRKRMIH